MGLPKRFFGKTRKPEGFLGKTTPNGVHPGRAKSAPTLSPAGSKASSMA